MAESIYDRYERLRDANNAGFRKLETRLEEAVELTELLQDVGNRVKAFIQAYEELNGISLATVKEIRDRTEQSPRSMAIADNIERDYQQIYKQGHEGAKDFTSINLDDLKVLLDFFAERQQLDVRI